LSQFAGNKVKSVNYKNHYEMDVQIIVLYSKENSVDRSQIN